LGYPAAATANAVDLHSSALPEPITVWCLGNAPEVRVAANGLGMRVDIEEGNPDFRFPGGQGDVYEWASSTNEEAVQAFDSACRLAYRAFSRSEVRPDESGSLVDSQAGLIGAIVGAVLTALFGVLTGARRKRIDSHEKDADELTDLSDQLRVAMERYIQPGHPDDAREEARVTASVLCNLVGEWRKYDGGSKDATAAQRYLRKILDDPAPKIGNLGANAQERTQGGQLLMEDVGTIHSRVGVLAKRVRRFGRLKEREANPPPAWATGAAPRPSRE
jgi:hypothetical protein